MASGVSSLLKSAASRRASIQQENNRLADMEWNLSAKTQDDYTTYVAHYEKALEKATGSDGIAYTNKLISARRSYASNEIQRASIRVYEGGGTNEDKLGLMVGLYNGAIDAGDLDLAQNLNSQIDSLYQTVANEKQQSMNLASQAYNAGYADSKAYVEDLKKGIASPFADDQNINLQAINGLLQEQGPDVINQVVNAISEKYGIPMASYEDMALYLAENTIATAEAVRNQYPVGSEEYAKLDQEVTKLRTTDIFELPGAKLSYDELKQTAENARLGMGGALSLVSTENGFQFTENKVANWTATTGPDGEIMFVPNYVMGTDVRATGTPGAQESRLTQGGEGYSLVTDEAGNQYYQTVNGDLYNTNGFSTKDGKVKGQKIGNVKDFEAEALKEKKLTTDQALKNLGYEADANYIYLPDGAGGQRPYEYKVDDNGNVQYYYALKNKDTGEVTKELYTIDTATGATATASEDFVKMKQEGARVGAIADRTQSAQSLLQNQSGASEIMQPAGTSALLQKGANITKDNQMKAAQIQQAATAAQISSIAPQKLAVQPIPQAPKISVQPVAQQPKVTVNATPSNAKVSVYQAPITQGTKPKVTVSNKPQFTGKLQVK